MEEIFNFLLRQKQSIKVGQAGNLPDFFIHGLVSGNVDIGTISFADNPEVTHEMDQVIRIDSVFEDFDFQYP